MSDKARRKELIREQKQIRPEPGVYRIINSQNGKSLLGSTPNLTSLRNRVEFAKTNNMPGALDGRLKEEIGRFGIDAFSLEILEVLETIPEMTQAQILEDLGILEALWREKMDVSLLY